MHKPPFSPSSRAFSLFELVATLAVLGTISALAFASISQSRDSAHETRLRNDVVQINSAIDVYRASGGSFAGATNAADVLAILQSSVAAGNEQFVGLSGSMLDTRLKAVFFLDAAIPAGDLRAVWNAAEQKFELARSGDGVTAFVVDENGPAPSSAGDNRDSWLAYNPNNGWIWNYTDEGTPTAPSPTLIPVSTPPTPPGDDGGSDATGSGDSTGSGSGDSGDSTGSDSSTGGDSGTSSGGSGSGSGDTGGSSGDGGGSSGPDPDPIPIVPIYDGVDTYLADFDVIAWNDLNSTGSIDGNALSQATDGTKAYDARDKFEAYSTELSGKTPNGSFDKATGQFKANDVPKAWGVVKFQVGVADVFGNGGKLDFIPSGAVNQILINVAGFAADLSGTEMVGKLKDYAQQGKVMWNFHDATSLELGSGDFYGTVLAPFATVNDATGGTLYGQLYASSITSDSAISSVAYAGDTNANVAPPPVGPAPLVEPDIQLSRTDFPAGGDVSVTIDNPNPPAESELFYRIDGGGAVPYLSALTLSAIDYPSGATIEAWAEPLPGYETVWASGAITAKFVRPVLTPFQMPLVVGPDVVDADGKASFSFTNPNDPAISKLVGRSNGGTPRDLGATWGFSGFHNGVELEVWVEPIDPDTSLYTNSPVATQKAWNYTLSPPAIAGPATVDGNGNITLSYSHANNPATTQLIVQKDSDPPVVMTNSGTTFVNASAGFVLKAWVEPAPGYEGTMVTSAITTKTVFPANTPLQPPIVDAPASVDETGYAVINFTNPNEPGTSEIWARVNGGTPGKQGPTHTFSNFTSGFTVESWTQPAPGVQGSLQNSPVVTTVVGPAAVPADPAPAY